MHISWYWGTRVDLSCESKLTSKIACGSFVDDVPIWDKKKKRLPGREGWAPLRFQGRKSLKDGELRVSVSQ